MKDHIDEGLSELRCDLRDLKTEVGETKTRVTNIEKYHFADKNEFEAAIKDHTDQLAMDIKADLQDRHFRRKRILISKIPDNLESDRNEDFVKDLAATIKIDISDVSFTKIFRINRRDVERSDGSTIPGKPFMLVELENEEHVQRFLNKSVWDELSKLPDQHIYKGTNINKDRTHKEREEYAKLKETRDKKNAELRSNNITNKQFKIKKSKVVVVDVDPA